MSDYPAEAVELTVTFLIPVTEENRSDVDGEVTDLLNNAGVTWWLERLMHFADNVQQVRYDFNRPAQWVRPRARRKSA